MSGLYLSPGLFPHEFLRPTVEFILKTQQPGGEIPWFPGGHSDPWDHVEAAMGLSIGGEHDAAVRAYRWLAQTQLDDGSYEITADQLRREALAFVYRLLFCLYAEARGGELEILPIEEDT